MIFNECNQHTRGSNHRVVERVCELHLSIAIFIADRQASCLRVRQVRTRTYFKILLLTGAPSFYVTALIFQIRQIARAATKLSYGNIQGTEKLYGIPLLGEMSRSDKGVPVSGRKGGPR